VEPAAGKPIAPLTAGTSVGRDRSGEPASGVVIDPVGAAAEIDLTDGAGLPVPVVLVPTETEAGTDFVTPTAALAAPETLPGTELVAPDDFGADTACSIVADGSFAAGAESAFGAAATTVCVTSTGSFATVLPAEGIFATLVATGDGSLTAARAGADGLVAATACTTGGGLVAAEATCAATGWLVAACTACAGTTLTDGALPGLGTGTPAASTACAGAGSIRTAITARAQPRHPRVDMRVILHRSFRASSRLADARPDGRRQVRSVEWSYPGREGNNRTGAARFGRLASRRRRPTVALPAIARIASVSRSEIPVAEEEPATLGELPAGASGVLAPPGADAGLESTSPRRCRAPGREATGEAITIKRPSSRKPGRELAALTSRSLAATGTPARSAGR
jgi:hypothetical protein